MSAESSERVKVIFPISIRTTNKDEGWYTLQVTFKAPRWAEKSLLHAMTYYVRKLTEAFNK